MIKNFYRKGLVIGIIILFFGANILPIVSGNNEKIDIKIFKKYNHTWKSNHTIFVEVATLQNCIPCSWWNQNIYDVYNSGEYNFEYVEMIVFDHSGNVLNEKANNWRENYNIYSFPTSIFDGDYLRLVGNHPDQLPEKLYACGNRSTRDITTDINATWLGDAKIKINIAIKNNEGGQYNGYIRACITEIISRYDTYYNEPYHFGFLDYAFPMNTAVSIPAGDTYINSVIWNGNEHEDTNGDNFGDIICGNIKIILSVFNSDNNFVDGVKVSTVLKDRAIIMPFLQFLESHPNLFTILQKLILRLGLQ